MWRMFREVASSGTTIPSAAIIKKEAFRSRWFNPPVRPFVAVRKGRIVGMSKLGPNQPDRGSHVSTATFIVNPADQGQGVGRSLVEHCLRVAKQRAFRGMQFNFVVSSNVAAVSLYARLGFSIVGTLPQALNHSALGYVDAFVMYRTL